jgi:hypothetical protein
MNNYKTQLGNFKANNAKEFILLNKYINSVNFLFHRDVAEEKLNEAFQEGKDLKKYMEWLIDRVDLPFASFYEKDLTFMWEIHEMDMQQIKAFYKAFSELHESKDKEIATNYILLNIKDSSELIPYIRKFLVAYDKVKSLGFIKECKVICGNDPFETIREFDL